MPAKIVGMAHSYNDKCFEKIIKKNKFTVRARAQCLDILLPYKKTTK